MRFPAAGFFLCCLAMAAAACDSSRPRLRLATTTSTRDSGLLDAILPVFEKEAGVRVDVIAVGTGKALKLGEAGDVDMVLVHSRAVEDAFMAAGHGIGRFKDIRRPFCWRGAATVEPRRAGRRLTRGPCWASGP